LDYVHVDTNNYRPILRAGR